MKFSTELAGTHIAAERTKDPTLHLSFQPSKILVAIYRELKIAQIRQSLKYALHEFRTEEKKELNNFRTGEKLEVIREASFGVADGSALIASRGIIKAKVLERAAQQIQRANEEVYDWRTFLLRISDRAVRDLVVLSAVSAQQPKFSRHDLTARLVESIREDLIALSYGADLPKSNVVVLADGAGRYSKQFCTFLSEFDECKKPLDLAALKELRRGIADELKEFVAFSPYRLYWGTLVGENNCLKFVVDQKARKQQRIRFRLPKV